MDSKITALIPTYNRPVFLRRAILSVLTQSYKNIQVSVFDNTPSDSAEKVVNTLRKSDPRILYHRHEHNIGVLKNIRAAFRSIETPFFSILSDDDALLHDFYENAMMIMQENADIMFVILNTLTIDENSNLIGVNASDGKITYYRGNSRLHTFDTPSTWNAILFRKEVSRSYLEMDDRFDFGADMRFLMHARARYNFAYFSKAGAFFTAHSASISAKKKFIDLGHHAIQISRYIEIYYDENVEKIFREKALLSIRKMLLVYKKKAFFIFLQALKIAIKKICTEENINFLHTEDEVKNARFAGFYITAFFLKLIYQNKKIKRLLHKVFSPHYRKRVLNYKNKMQKLQNGVYKKEFEKLKEISF